MSFREDKNLELYKYEYLYFDEPTIDWIWLEADEVNSYMANDDDVTGLSWRKATQDETYAYNEAYADGHGLALAESRMERDNGVYYELVNFSASGIETKKIFTCGDCEKSGIDFEYGAAKTGPYYVTKEIETILWHICIDCAYDCRHDWTHFSRSLCACGGMHEYCDTCSEALSCELNQEDNWDSPYKRKKK